MRNRVKGKVDFSEFLIDGKLDMSATLGLLTDKF